MIRALRLGNFKAFAETQHIPLRPITLVYGPNSAGKSSIIHSLALAHHAILTGDLDTQRTEIGGESIDLGGFHQYVHRRETGRRVEWSIELDTSKVGGRLGERLAKAKTVELALTIGMGEMDDRQPDFFGGFARISGPQVGVETCSLLADEKPIITMSARRGGKLRVDRLEHEHPVLREILKALVTVSTTTQELSPEDFAGIEETVDAVVPDLVVRQGNLLPEMDARLSADQEVMQSLLLPVAKGERREDLARAVRMFLPRSIRELINGVSEAVATAVRRLRYLGPLRSYPPRHLAFAAHHDPNWRAGGGEAWDVLRRDDDVRAAVNRWLGSTERLSTPYEVVVRNLLAFDQLDDPLREALEALDEGENLKIEGGFDRDAVPDVSRATIADIDQEVENFKAKLGAADIDRFAELVLVDRRRSTVVSHRDVGIGVSQVLPVLVNAYALRNQLLAIEQPEIHLHPKLQAELGDVFVESALGERHNTLLLETHSEHVILRILRRIRDTAEGSIAPGTPGIRPSDVSLLYVQPDGTASRVIQIGITEEGEFSERWPNGFFAERARELM
jgi:predicted ATPase